MVSTRQMATSGGNGGNTSTNNFVGNGGGSCTSSGNIVGGSNASASTFAIPTNTISAVAAASNSISNNAAESARLSVVTRQTSSQYVLVNCSTIAPTPQQHQRNLGNHGTAVSASTSRQSQLTQAFKANGSVGAGNHFHNSSSSSSSSGSSNSTILISNNQSNGNNISFDNGIDVDNQNCNRSRQLHLLDLPLEILSYILSFVGFKKVGQLRLVSHKFNDVCMHILNSTFSKLITQTFNRVQAIKANMPRRESARRKHPLACECDIIETCYMRLSLLQMTFGKHIERGHCCFFPGAILDEVYTIINHIKNTPCLERPYRVTDELFDLSTMAMEYFHDRIEATLPDIAYFNKDFFKMHMPAKKTALVIAASNLSESSSSLPSPPQSNMVLRKGIRKIKQGMKIYNNQLSVLRTELRTCKRKSAEQGKQIAEQQKLLADQQKQTLEYANRLDENDKKNEEMARKFSTLLQELNKCKTELQYWRSKSPAMPTCTACGQKCAPLLPPEDYQALINQGVKLDELNDDTDAESDVSMGENQMLSLSSEFVFPDENTTAKLLAINSATKNLKRQHANSTITSMQNAKAAANSGDNASSCGMTSAEPSAAEAEEPLLKMTNSLECAQGSGNHTIRTITCTPGLQQTDLSFIPPEASTSSSNGYSTKMFYGSNVHKGVIVSPSMMWAKNNEAAAAASAGQQGSDVCAPSAESSRGSCSAAVESVSSLANLASHETKKARRVQKSGKRSK